MNIDKNYMIVFNCNTHFLLHFIVLLWQSHTEEKMRNKKNIVRICIICNTHPLYSNDVVWQ